MSTQNKTAVEKLEQAKRKFLELTDTVRRCQVEVEAGRRQLREAEEEALSEYGTKNLDEIRALFRQREEQNHAIVDQFCEALAEAEARLAKAQRALNA